MENKLINNKSSYIERYRPEIDGLRAFAVIAVIINHFNKEILPGGYLGVDIFFVISGYVITSSLDKKTSKHFQEFIGGFYERRVKRLIPALTVFVFITSFMICLFNQYPTVALRTGLTSLFGISNLYLLKQATDYFAPSAELNSFMHTWSLGVEEQFYLIFPFLIWFSGFGRQSKKGIKNFTCILGTLAFLSFISFIYLYKTNQSMAYFMMPTRFWEIATGSLIFIIFQRKSFIKQYLRTTPPSIFLIMIIGVMYLPVSFGALATILIVFLSSILLISLRDKTNIYIMLTNSRIVFIGLISYSLYLWHWSVISISRWTIGIHWWSIPLQIGLIFGLATFSYIYIEIPFRKGFSLRKKWKTFLTAFGALFSLSSLILLVDIPLKGKLFTGNKNQIITKTFPLFKKEEEECMNLMLKNTSCYLINNNSDRSLWVLGDSHASSMLPAAIKIVRSLNMNLRLFTAGGTPFPPINNYRNLPNEGVSLKEFKLIEQRLLKEIKTGDIIFLSMRLPYHFDGIYYGGNSSGYKYIKEDGSIGTPKEYLQKWINSVNNLANYVGKKGARVIIQTPTPEWEKEYWSMICTSGKQWFNSLQDQTCKISSSFFKDNLKGKYNHIFREIYKLTTLNSNVYLLDTYKILCPEEICKFRDHGIQLYGDPDHLTQASIEKLIYPKLLELIKDELK